MKKIFTLFMLLPIVAAAQVKVVNPKADFIILGNDTLRVMCDSMIVVGQDTVPLKGFIDEEVDPIWTADKTNYYTASEVDGLPVSTFDNDVPYLTSYSETDPIFSADSANIVHFDELYWQQDGDTVSTDKLVGIGTTAPTYDLTIAGKIAINDGGNSVCLGDSTGYNDDGTNNNNTFIGHNAGNKNTSGGNNMFIGFESGYSNTMGSNNTFSGYGAGTSNTMGSQNTFNGFYSGNSNTVGYNNTFSGVSVGGE